MISVLRRLKNAAGAAITNEVVTNSSLTLSETIAPGGMDAIGILLDVGSTATGTTPTIQATLQCSPDGGTSWFDVTAKGGTVSVSSGALSAGATAKVYWADVPLAESGEATNPLLRWAFSYNHTDNDFAAINAFVAMRKFNQRHP